MPRGEGNADNPCTLRRRSRTGEEAAAAIRLLRRLVAGTCLRAFSGEDARARSRPSIAPLEGQGSSSGLLPWAERYARPRPLRDPSGGLGRGYRDLQVDGEMAGESQDCYPPAGPASEPLSDVSHDAGRRPLADGWQLLIPLSAPRRIAAASLLRCATSCGRSCSRPP